MAKGRQTLVCAVCMRVAGLAGGVGGGVTCLRIERVCRLFTKHLKVARTHTNHQTSHSLCTTCMMHQLCHAQRAHRDLTTRPLESMSHIFDRATYSGTPACTMGGQGGRREGSAAKGASRPRSCFHPCQQLPTSALLGC